jgi:hypothetical protein
MTPSPQAIECRCRRDQETSEKLLADLAVVWEEHGKDVLEKSAMDDPGKLATIAYGLLPRDVFTSIEQKDTGKS